MTSEHKLIAILFCTFVFCAFGSMTAALFAETKTCEEQAK